MAPADELGKLTARLGAQAGQRKIGKTVADVV
jgi:hypothetical protein